MQSLFSEVHLNGKVGHLLSFWLDCDAYSLSACPSEASVYCSSFAFELPHISTGRYERKKNKWSLFMGYERFRKKNPNMSLCCWRRSWLYLFNVESYDTVKEKNRYLRLGLQSRKQKWRGYYLQSPVEAPFRSPTVTCLPHSNEILLFQNKSISFTGAVFKKGYSIPNQCVYFDSTLNGLLTPDEAARLQVKDKKYCWASLIKWALLKEKRTEEKYCLAC